MMTDMEDVENIARPLTEADKLEVFRRATRALPRWYPDAVRRGMTDADLAEALEKVLGDGGSGGPNMLDVSHKGAGLRIWGGWSWPNIVTDPPLFAGNATIAKAREGYSIADPDNRQLSLL